MKRITLILATVLSLAFTQVTAQDFNKGLEAAQAGDFATALKEWQPLAEQGDALAQGNLGIMYQNGDGVPKDATQAVKWFRLSPEQGHANAQYNLGTKYDQGNGVFKDYAEAAKWWRLSAEQGHALAQYNLGVMYVNGNGVLQDNITSYMWYDIASANGDEDAGERRDKLATLITASDISAATAMAIECMRSDYKKCGY